MKRNNMPRISPFLGGIIVKRPYQYSELTVNDKRRLDTMYVRVGRYRRKELITDKEAANVYTFAKNYYIKHGKIPTMEELRVVFPFLNNAWQIIFRKREKI
ncbi:MAG: hypothetical protein Q8P05_05260 [Candidatus Diapherotrites archaeon]|nr:hypothetical protein [Candidatus Diapherotrites archaeon]MDZ4256035.1 hypothetical protein [archaeon]